MSIPKDIINKHPEIDTWSILSGYRGSIAHGMYTPNTIDDKDVMVIIVPPCTYYFGLDEYGSRGTKEIQEGEWDIVVYEFKKFVSLLMKGNPNVLTMLWLEKESYINLGECGKMLIEKRDLFSSKQVYHSFVGYAYGQLHRMTHHAFNGYMGDKRKKLVEKYGYDTKNAAHLIRLLKMAIEFLVEGVFYVKRQDSQYLLEIKNGLWTLDQVKNSAESLFKQAENAYINCKLPNVPDKEKVNEVMCNVFWRLLDGY